MYDMYPWDSASQGDYPPEPLRSRKAPAQPKPQAQPQAPAQPQAQAKAPAEPSPAQAVQVALDRRDNGGDAVAVADPVAHPATSPAPGWTRQ